MNRHENAITVEQLMEELKHMNSKGTVWLYNYIKETRRPCFGFGEYGPDQEEYSLEFGEEEEEEEEDDNGWEDE